MTQINIQQTLSVFPVAEVLNGTYTKIGFDETDAWAHNLVGLVAAELKARADRLSDHSGPDFTSWLEDADNFLKFLLVNFSDETVLIMCKLTVSQWKLPYRTQRMKNFDSMAKRMATYLTEIA